MNFSLSASKYKLNSYNYQSKNNKLNYELNIHDNILNINRFYHKRFQSSEFKEFISAIPMPKSTTAVGEILAWDEQKIAVLNALAFYCNKYKKLVFVTHEELAFHINRIMGNGWRICRQTVCKIIKFLKEKGLIAVCKSPGKKSCFYKLSRWFLQEDVYYELRNKLFSLKFQFDVSMLLSQKSDSATQCINVFNYIYIKQQAKYTNITMKANEERDIQRKILKKKGSRLSILEKLRDEFKFGDYELSQLAQFNEKTLHEAFSRIKRRHSVKHPFKILQLICKDVLEGKPAWPAGQAPAANFKKDKPSASAEAEKAADKEPDWVKDYVDEKPHNVALSIQEMQDEITYQERKIKTYKGALEEAKRRYANSTNRTAVDLRAIDGYWKSLCKAQARYDQLHDLLGIKKPTTEEKVLPKKDAVDIANGISTFLGEESMEKLKKFMKHDKAITYRDNALWNWLNSGFIFDPENIDHQLAMRVINNHLAKFDKYRRYESGFTPAVEVPPQDTTIQQVKKHSAIEESIDYLNGGINDEDEFPETQVES